MGRSRRYLWMRVLKDWRLYVGEKTVRGREFQSLDVIGINELANAFVQLVSNLRVLNLRKSCISRKWSLWRDYWLYLVGTKAVIISIKKGKGRRQLYDGLGSRECQLMLAGSPISLTARLWMASKVAKIECVLVERITSVMQKMFFVMHISLNQTAL